MRRDGPIEATLSYEERVGDSTSQRQLTLVVRRGGAVALDDRRYPFHAGDQVEGMTLRNVWGDAEPEVLVDVLSGGNGCCVHLGVGLVDAHGDGRVLVHDFGEGFHAERHDGRVEFVSQDHRFFCTFSDCASASMPIQILAVDSRGRRFVDVTRSRPSLVATDAAGQWKSYTRELGKHNQYDRIGVLGPWCADEYLLGRGGRCEQTLARALAQGLLDAPGHGGRATVALLHEKLRAWGYDR